MKTKNQNRDPSFVKATFLALGVGVLVVVGSSCLLASLISAGKIQQPAMGKGCFVIWTLAALVSSAAGALMHRDNRLAACCAVTCGLFGTFVLLGLPFATGFDGVGMGLTANVLGGGVALLLTRKANNSGAKKGKYRRFR